MLIVNNLNKNGQNIVTRMLSANIFTMGHNINLHFLISANCQANHDFHREFRSHLWFDRRWIACQDSFVLPVDFRLERY